jgi:hypothetical protein
VKAATLSAEARVTEEDRASECKRITTQIIMGVDNLASRCEKAVKVIKHSAEVTSKENNSNDASSAKFEETLLKLEVMCMCVSGWV